MAHSFLVLVHYHHGGEPWWHAGSHVAREVAERSMSGLEATGRESDTEPGFSN